MMEGVDVDEGEAGVPGEVETSLFSRDLIVLSIVLFRPVSRRMVPST